MAKKYNHDELKFLWVAGGHSAESFTDAVYRFLTAAQGGPPDDPPERRREPDRDARDDRDRRDRDRGRRDGHRDRDGGEGRGDGSDGSDGRGDHDRGDGGGDGGDGHRDRDGGDGGDGGFTPITVVEHGPNLGSDVVFTTAIATTEYGRNINTVLRVGYQLDAPELALLAMLCLGFGENSWRTSGCNSSDHCGVFQLSSSLQAEHDYTDVAYWARRAYQSGFYSYGGIIPIALAHPDYSPGRITNMCQGAYANLDEGARYYNGYEGAARTALRVYGHDARRGIRYGGGSGSGLPYSNSVTGANLLQQIKAIDWAGDVENTYKYMRGGSNQAAHMAQTFSESLHDTEYVKPA